MAKKLATSGEICRDRNQSVSMAVNFKLLSPTDDQSTIRLNGVTTGYVRVDVNAK